MLKTDIFRPATSSSRTFSGTECKSIVDILLSKRCHLSCCKLAGGVASWVILSSGFRDMCRWYHDSTAFTIVVHHSSLVEVISAAMGSTINNQSPSCSGPCEGLHGGRPGRSNTPDLTTSTPLIEPPSSLCSETFFCISFIDSTIKLMNSNDF